MRLKKKIFKKESCSSYQSFIRNSNGRFNFQFWSSSKQEFVYICINRIHNFLNIHKYGIEKKKIFIDCFIIKKIQIFQKTIFKTFILNPNVQGEFLPLSMEIFKIEKKKKKSYFFYDFQCCFLNHRKSNFLFFQILKFPLIKREILPKRLDLK